MKYTALKDNNHHDYLHQSDKNLIRINVSGKEFTTTKETLRLAIAKSSIFPLCLTMIYYYSIIELLEIVIRF